MIVSGVQDATTRGLEKSPSKMKIRLEFTNLDGGVGIPAMLGMSIIGDPKPWAKYFWGIRISFFNIHLSFYKDECPWVWD